MHTHCRRACCKFQARLDSTATALQRNEADMQALRGKLDETAISEREAHSTIAQLSGEAERTADQISELQRQVGISSYSGAGLDTTKVFAGLPEKHLLGSPMSALYHEHVCQVDFFWLTNP